MKKAAAAFLFIYITIVYLMFLFWEPDRIYAWTREDGFFENLTAIMLFVGSILFFVLFAKDRKGNDFGFWKPIRNIFYLLLGLFFLFGAGEEISWGQRIFGFGTPESMLSSNVQHEFNIHNLKPFMDREHGGGGYGIISLLFSTKAVRIYFWFGYGVCIPILAAFKSRFSRFLNKIAIPIVPLYISALFVYDYVFFKALSTMLPALTGEHHMGSHMNEVRECNFAIFFFLATLAWHAAARKTTTP